MRFMSRGPGGGARALYARAGLFARILLPAAVAIAVLALLLGDARQIDSELHLLAPDRHARGQSVPLRAHLYARLRRPEGPELAAAPLAVELRAGTRVLARTELRAGYANTLDGALALPEAFTGRAVLVAEAEQGGADVRSERVLDVVPAAELTAPLDPRARALPALQRFAPGPVQAHAGAAAVPSALSLQIEGGVCVPERPCTVLVHVGEPAAAVRVLETPSVTPDARSRAPSEATSGVVALRVVTHGPEAALRIAVERDGARVATRAFRLAVALGASALRELPRVLNAPAAPSLGLHEEEPGCIVDAFHALRWARTGSLAECRGREPLPFAPLTPGLWRLQLRRDPFASGSAAVASVYVRAPGEADPQVLARLARAALARDPGDALARALSADQSTDSRSFEADARYLLALLDRGVVALPEPVSGYPRALARLQAARGRVRTLALAVIASCAAILGLLVLQRGLSAASEASRVMTQAGEERAGVDKQRLRMRLRVLAAVASLLLLFAAIAAYVVVRAAAF